MAEPASFMQYASFNDNEDTGSSTSILDTIRNPISTRCFQDIQDERAIDINKCIKDRKNVDYGGLFNNTYVKEEKVELDEGYLKYIETLEELKKEICNVFLDFTESELKVTEAKKSFDVFCESIKSAINSIQTIGLGDSDDQLMVDILTKKIDSYYSILDIENLEKNHLIISDKYSIVKKQMNTVKNYFVKQHNICNICMDNGVEFFIDPCGHTLCGNCKNKCTSSNCHYCRNTRKAFKKLYY